MTPDAFTTLDQKDPLRAFRQYFDLPADVVYLDGNSLGALPKATPARVREVVEEEWGQQLIRSWNTRGWIDLQRRIGDKIGRIIGAEPGETLVADSTSVNLFKLLAGAVKLRPGRTRIISEIGNFPTDLYIAQGLAALLGDGIEVIAVKPEDVESVLDERVAVLMLTHVNYGTGAMYDMAQITERAHDVGALMLWDLAHSAGAVPVELNAAGADLAVGCGYKYLNGGPGAPAFLYVAERHQAQLQPAISGWFGHAAPFAFEGDYRPAGDIMRLAVGTPPVISLAALEIGVDLMLDAPISAIRDKSIRQTELFIELVDQEIPELRGSLASPSDPLRRGSQVCLRHPDAWPIMQALIARGVIGDFRAPDILRFGFTPLYVGYADIWKAVRILRHIMVTGEWRQDAYQAKSKVT
ncbi:kynureninase [Solimonas marina]|uniref:Kynureninase n=1 Tax=Solimonas marina TaxID=2714601 RepID=A0A969W9Y4_9GAMM|nr:kynureninase [Solimonas marina]NKF22619.1 kynureninase [Solimonas marina]